jgi:hypothetical protein
VVILQWDKVRQFSLTEKIKLKCQNQSNSFLMDKTNLINPVNGITKNWSSLNEFEKKRIINVNSEKLVIYPYSLSKNLLNEVLLKMGLKVMLTNEIKKANLIIGLKKHLKQNFKLKNLAKQKNIPIYTLNQVNIYQVMKLVKFINL